MPERVAAVVSCLNNHRTIEQCLRTLIRNRPDEVIVVDGGSSDGTQSILSKFPQITIIDNMKGIANARNIGWRHSHGDLTLFLDGDAYMTMDTLVSLKQILKSTDAAGVTCRIAGANLDKLIPRLRDLDFRIQYSESFCRSNIADCVSDPAICGLYRREVLEEVGGFNPEFPFAEDMEFLEKLRSRRYRVVSCYSPPILHNHRETVSSLFWQLYRHGFGRGVIDAKSSSPNLYARRKLKQIRRGLSTLSLAGSTSLLYPFYRMIADTAYVLGYLKGRKWKQSRNR